MDLTDLVDRKAERREFDRLRRREERESMCASVGGGGNMGVTGAETTWETDGMAQERWRWRSSVSRVVINVSIM